MRAKRYFILQVILAIVAIFSASQASAINSHQIRTQTDASGKITVAVFERIAGAAQQHFIDFGIDVPPGFVAIGGGLEAANQPYGNLITASYPNSNLSSWLVSSKDHSQPNPVKLKGYAVGLKVEGLSRDQLFSYITVNVNSSGWVQHPDIAAGIPSNYVMIGGGIKVNWTGAGNLATATYPETSFSWRAKSKDHSQLSPATTQVFAIAIKRYIVGVGQFETNISSNTSSSAQHPGISTNVSPGYALVGCGAEVHWSGAGNLLWKLKPATQGSQHGCDAASKDHTHVSPATITAYAVGLKLN